MDHNITNLIMFFVSSIKIIMNIVTAQMWVELYNALYIFDMGVPVYEDRFEAIFLDIEIRVLNTLNVLKSQILYIKCRTTIYSHIFFCEHYRLT